MNMTPHSSSSSVNIVAESAYDADAQTTSKLLAELAERTFASIARRRRRRIKATTTAAAATTAATASSSSSSATVDLITDAELSMLQTCFGAATFLKALEIVDARRVRTVVAAPSGRHYHLVAGSGARPYLVLLHAGRGGTDRGRGGTGGYCTCAAWLLSVAQKETAACCKHVLATRLAAALGTTASARRRRRDGGGGSGGGGGPEPMCVSDAEYAAELMRISGGDSQHQPPPQQQQHRPPAHHHV